MPVVVDREFMQGDDKSFPIVSQNSFTDFMSLKNTSNVYSKNVINEKLLTRVKILKF